MLLTNVVKTTWHPKTKKWYESKGYIFTKMRDFFEINTIDLINGSNIKVKVKCDNCGKIYFTQWYYYNKQFLEYKKTSCKVCAYKLYGNDNRIKTKLKKGISFEQWCINNHKEDFLLRWDYQLNKCNPNEINYGTKNKYYFKCPYDMHKSELKEIENFTNHITDMKCNACNSFGQYLINTYGENSIKSYWSDKNTINPFEISYCSGQKIWIKCSICKNEKNISPAQFIMYGLACPKCSDGISYSEKIMYSLLNQLNIDFQTQLNKTTFKWCKGENYDYKYDFYIPSLNCIIETHGKQHYKNCNRKGARTLQEEQVNDILKEKLAKENGIENYIVIDCRYSDLKFIKNKILNSKLSEIYDLSNIDWIMCEKFINISLVKIACDLWNSKIETVNKLINISNEMKLCKNTIRNYLKRGSKIGLCTYNPYEESKKALKRNRCKKVYCVELNKIYNSIQETSHDLNISVGIISKVCNRKLETAGKLHYHFYYFEDNKIVNL